MVQKNKHRHLQRGSLVFAIVFLISSILALLVISAAIGLNIWQLIRPQLTTHTIQPQVSDAVILNPGKGWVLYGMPSDHRASTLAYAAVGYLRYDWSTIEPTEGQYNWSVIDDALNAWKAQGKQFAFGVMNADSSEENVPYITPQWVFADGAASLQSHSFDQISGATGLQYIPVWNDPIYLRKVQTFLNALAQRYDGTRCTKTPFTTPKLWCPGARPATTASMIGR